MRPRSSNRCLDGSPLPPPLSSRESDADLRPTRSKISVGNLLPWKCTLPLVIPTEAKRSGGMLRVGCHQKTR